LKGGEVWHESCFNCAQCFRPFGKDGLFFEFEGRKYCQHDFNVLYAPCCAKCGQFIIGWWLILYLNKDKFLAYEFIINLGRVIKALCNNWHPDCFTCAICHSSLADQGFIKNASKHIVFGFLIELNCN